MKQYTYDITVNGIKHESGVSMGRIQALKNKGYNVVINNKYLNDSNDYNSIAIKTSEY